MVLLKHQTAPTLLIVRPSCSADNEAIKPEHNTKNKQEDRKMKNTNMTEIKMDQLEKVTGGADDSNGLPPTVPENEIDPKVINNI